MENVVAVGLHTLVSVEAFDQIFFDFKDAVYEVGMRDCFYPQLEPYLIMGKIKWAPTKDIRAICQIYSKNDRTVVIRNFLLNLSVDAFDYNFLIATCLENGLHYPLIYICTQSIYEDFMMPATKLYKEFSDAKIVFDQINQSKFGHLCLWYIRMVLRGECLGQPIKLELRAQVVLQLSIFFFTEQILGQLLSLDCKLVLSVYKDFFIMPNIDYINQKDFRDTIGLKTDKKKKDLTIQMKHHIKGLLTVRATKYGLNNPENIKTFYDFETSLLQYKYVEFEKADLIEIIDYNLDSRDSRQEYDSFYSDSDKPKEEDLRSSQVTMCLRYQNGVFNVNDLEEIKARLDPAVQ